jgi:branched-chain amino acid aminotransferase
MAKTKTYQVNVEPGGALEELFASEPDLSLDEISNRLPAGAYTTFRTFQQTKALRLDDHFKRLEETARLAGHTITLDRTSLRDKIRQSLAASQFSESRVRLTIDLEKKVGQIYLSVEHLIVPLECEYAMGVKVTTQSLHRENPKAKLTNFIHTAAKIKQSMPKGINEVLMIGGDGEILEGLSSNFFAVIADEIWTAEKGVLSGITRALTLEEAGKAGIPVHFNPPLLNRQKEYQEAFITSTSRDVLPVIQIDQNIISNGKPGKISQLLLQRYRQRVASELQAI